MAGRDLDDYFPSVLETSNVDYVVSHGPVVLLGVAFAASGGDSGAVLRNGTTDKGTGLITLKALNGTGYSYPLPEPVLCRNGLFIDPDDANAYVSVQWAPLPERAPE